MMGSLCPPPDCPVVVGIGEALFDCLPDGEWLGGAPVNMTVHLHRLLTLSGGRGMLVSRVGNDARGDRLVGELEERGLPTNLIQVDAQHPTGLVNVELQADGQPRYDIAEGVAWDYLAFEDSLELLAFNCSAVCFGTLAQRSDVTRKTIHRFLKATGNAIRLLDVNLRKPHFSAEVLLRSFQLANVVKLNEEELGFVGALLFPNANSNGNTDEKAYACLREFGLHLLALTRGAQGTVFYSNEERLEGEPIQFTPLPGADSVGAGDACCAGILYGLLRSWPLERTLDLANQMGAFVASQPGATPTLPDEILKFAGSPTA
jgi:fructokinase